jgi:hypothetical protein
LNKQQNNEATKEQKLAIEKYLYKKHFKVNVIDKEFLDKYFRKIHVLINLKLLLGKKDIKLYNGIDENQIIRVNFDKIKKQEQINMIKQVINKLGFKFDNMNNKINKEDFLERINRCQEKCSLFIDTQKSQPLFGFNKKKLGSVKSFLGFINTLLKDWGLKIQSDHEQKSVRENGKVKSKRFYFYTINYIDDFNTYA